MVVLLGLLWGCLGAGVVALPTDTGAPPPPADTGPEDSEDSEDTEDTEDTTPPDEDCADGKDNDLDGLIDCEDADCADAWACQEDCEDGEDNDNDGLTDCQDDDCLFTEHCAPDEVSVQITGGTAYITIERESFYREYASPHWGNSTTHTLLAYSVSGTVLYLPVSASTWGSCTFQVATVSAEVEVVNSTLFDHFHRNSLTRNGVSLSAGCPLNTSSFLPSALKAYPSVVRAGDWFSSSATWHADATDWYTGKVVSSWSTSSRRTDSWESSYGAPRTDWWQYNTTYSRLQLSP